MGFHSYHHVRPSCWGLRKDCTAQVASCAVEPLFMCYSVGLFHLFPLKLCGVCVWDLRGSALEQPWKWGCLTFLLSPVLLPVDCTRKMSYGGPYVPYKKHLQLDWMGGLTKSSLCFRNVRDLGEVMPTINWISKTCTSKKCLWSLHVIFWGTKSMFYLNICLNLV